MKKISRFVPFLGVAALAVALGSTTGCDSERRQRLKEERAALKACAELLESGLRPIAANRAERFLGKVEEATARCRGGDHAAEFRSSPWNDWANYWGAADASSMGPDLIEGLEHLNATGRGVDGALLDLEYQRIELIKFNLFDNYTYPQYSEGRDGVPGPALRVWDEMRLPPEHPNYVEVGAGAEQQLCNGQLIRHRTVDGICNDMKNPLMGSTGTLFARNVQFETSFPRLGETEMVRNRHGDRLDLLKPDPQLISRKLFTREQGEDSANCKKGYGLGGNSKESGCDYQEAPFMNVLAAFWIQFMNHDWFSHIDEGKNSPEMMALGCDSPEAREAGCRPEDRMDKALVADEPPASTFASADGDRFARAPRTFRNTNTAWWDGSQIYGYDERSRSRVKRDPSDAAKLLMMPRSERADAGDDSGYLPILASSDPMLPQWKGQAATGFPDNWTVGMAFYHNVFAREHNAFVDGFRGQAAATPDDDSGLRDPASPDDPITYAEVSADELFEVARLVVSAEIAKIHTIEWTTQLLYNEPLYRAMNANWGGLFGENEVVDRALARVFKRLQESENEKAVTTAFSVFASGPGILGLGSEVYADGSLLRKLSEEGKQDIWSLSNPEHVNGGVNHFGSPFNFPEEFMTVYRLHPLVPDLIEYRDHADPDKIQKKYPVVESFRGPATEVVNETGLTNLGLSMGRQRLGALTLNNHAQFLQNLKMERLGESAQLDVAALDLIRDRERGIPRFNEFRRQYGLKQLTSFDDFVDYRLAADHPERKRQESYVKVMRDIYGQHQCDASKVITEAQYDDEGRPINDCLGHPDGSMIDNIEDVDTVVGWLAEGPRPHGYAISETQFVVFIINASRRLFSDRFFTSSYRPEFYTQYGLDWVNHNGPGEKKWEKGEPNGHRQEVSPMKRVLQRTLPELKAELDPVINVFDPWNRDRGEYYSLAWTPRPGAEADESFQNK